MEEQYLNIRFSLLFNSNFTSDEKLILAEMVSLSSLPKGCVAGDNHFAKLINKSRPTTNGIIKNLQARGYITLIVKKGIGKTTKLVDNFWGLVSTPVERDDNSAVVQEPVVVENTDTTCRYKLQEGVENEDTTCRETDTTITFTNTDLLVQEVLEYTGATETYKIDSSNSQYNDVYLKLIELITLDPAKITNPFVKQFQHCFAGLYLFFGHDFLENCHIFKNNNELYEIYGSSNFYEVRQDLTYVRENMDRFLRLSNLI
jgi:hypothetical protein